MPNLAAKYNTSTIKYKSGNQYLLDINDLKEGFGTR